MTALHKELQSLLLPSGRTLAFAVFGKPKGLPVIYLHGFPTCRLEAIAFDAPARRANIRLIAPDRPGIRQSSLAPDRSILDHAEDVRAFALPKEMLTGVGILSGMGTYEKNDVGLVPLGGRVTGWLARNAPRTLEYITDVFVAGLQRMVRWGWVERKIDQMPESSRKDKYDEGWTPVASRERLLNNALEPSAQGSGGMAQEAALVSQPWGFKLDEVHYPVRIWHGVKDVNAPIEWIRAMAEKIPNRVLHVYEEGTHGGVMKYMDDVFSELLHEEKVEADQEGDNLRRRRMGVQ
ncbi:alpha/beta-hydrolase [Bimuria novae-zelandiae CBS 107.79]|uniref:Alpha/beta-hydrolase n=1 Tax=Bimuria novae-zelandiae CBS 107.79 TaxID=1447943 RepID=A0A6A5VLK7_9PLEO|nr:alpha/beta-hydrolase [Bimuria novae-zelandiae CBS 107.79]